jgi:hypothetical protein
LKEQRQLLFQPCAAQHRREGWGYAQRWRRVSNRPAI